MFSADKKSCMFPLYCVFNISYLVVNSMGVFGMSSMI